MLKIGRVYVVVTSRPTLQWDPEFYRSVGLEPENAHSVVVKSPAASGAAYEPLAAEIILTDAKGVCCSDLRSLPYKHVRRPTHPLDDMTDRRIASVWESRQE
jgi:microcystin degradation protein MlrC